MPTVIRRRLPLAKLLTQKEVSDPESIPEPSALLKQDPPSVMGLIERVMKDRNTRLHYFRPSMLAGCRRANCYWYNHTPEEEPTHDPRMHRILDAGTANHRMVQGWLGNHYGIEFTPELPIYVPALRIRGSADGKLRRRSDGYAWGLEIKTKDHTALMSMSRPEKAHVVQASIYARLMGVHWITILYYDRGKQTMREFNVPYDPKIWDEFVMVRIKELSAFVDAGEMPEFDSDECNKSIDFCKFVKRCHADRGVKPRGTIGRGVY